MGLKTKIKLILGACCVILAVTCFVAFNSFGIDADTIYKLQGEMDTTMYNRARGYMYSGNEVFGLFSEEEEGVTDVPDAGEGEVYTDAPVDYEDIGTLDSVTPASTDGMPAPLYKQSDPRWASIEYYPNNSIGTAGCFPTSLTMIVGHMTGTTDTPDVVIQWIQSNVKGYYVARVGSSHVIIEPVVEHYGLHVELSGVAMTKGQIQECLDRGGCILFRTDSGWFTGNKHGMAILGYANDREHVYINNPSNSGHGQGCPAGNGNNYNDSYAFSIDEICSSPATKDPKMWTIYK